MRNKFGGRAIEGEQSVTKGSGGGRVWPACGQSVARVRVGSSDFSSARFKQAASFLRTASQEVLIDLPSIDEMSFGEQYCTVGWGAHKP